MNMAAITTAQAKALKRKQPFRDLISRYGDGFYLFLTNFDADSGEFTVSYDDTATGTEATSFTVDSTNTDDVKLKLAKNASADGNYTITIQPATATWTANRTLSLPDPGASDSFVYAALAQTLTNKTLTAPIITTPTITVPVIASFASAQHDHSSAAQGGGIGAQPSLSGTTGTTFTIGAGGTIPKAAITVLGSTGNYTATLQIPTLAADRTITFPAVTATLATITGTETLTNKTLTSPSMTLPTIADGLLASGSVANNFSGSTGTFLTSTGAVTIGSGAVGITGAVTMATTKGITFGAAAAGTATPLTMYSLTANKGALIIAVADATGDYATTLTNGDPSAAATITLPAATGTLAALNGTNTWTGVQVISKDDASNTSVTDLLTLTHTTSGASGAGIGAGISVIVENDTDATTEVANIDFVTTNDGTKATLDTDVSIKTMLGGTCTQALLIDASAQEVHIGVSASDADGINTLRIFPHTTAGRGSLVLTSAIHASADYSCTITQATDLTASQVITIPNCGDAADTFALLDTAQTFSAVKTFTAAPVISVTDVATNSVVDVATIKLIGGVPANGLGLGLSFIVENATDSTTQVASIDVVNTEVTKASADTDILFSNMLAGTVTETLRIDASDQSITVGRSSTDANGINKVRIFPLTAASGSLVLQAAVDASGDHATTVTNAVDCAAAATVTLPSGTSKLAGMATNTATTSAGDSLAIPVTHGVVAKTTGADGESLTLADGFPGQELFIYLAVDGGGDGVLTPTTKTGFATITFADAGDAVLLRFLPTVGWIIIGAYGYAAPPVIAA
jgi:hypothetical protein